MRGIVRALGLSLFVGAMSCTAFVGDRLQSKHLDEDGGCFMCADPSELGDGSAPIDGNVNHSDGAAGHDGGFQTMTSGATVNLNAVWGSSAAAVWAGGELGTLLLFDGSKWEAKATPNNLTVYAIAGNAANDVFAAAGAQLWHYDGASWEIWADSGDSVGGDNIESIYPTGDAHDDVIALLDSSHEGAELLRFDGQTKQMTILGTTHHDFIPPASIGLWASSASDVWFGCDSTYHYDGSQVVAAPSMPPQTYRLWGASPQAIFGTQYSAVQLFDGAHWQQLTTGFAGSITDISGTSVSRVVIVGRTVSNAGHVLLYDGEGFTDLPLPSGVLGLNGVWAASSAEIFVVGDQGTIVKGP